MITVSPQPHQFSFTLALYELNILLFPFKYNYNYKAFRRLKIIGNGKFVKGSLRVFIEYIKPEALKAPEWTNTSQG